MLAGVQRAHSSGPIVVGERAASTINSHLHDAARQKVDYVSGDRKREGIFANLASSRTCWRRSIASKSRGGKARSHRLDGARRLVRVGAGEAVDPDGRSRRQDHLAERRQPAEGADRSRLRARARTSSSSTIPRAASTSARRPTSTRICAISRPLENRSIYHVERDRGTHRLLLARARVSQWACIRGTRRRRDQRRPHPRGDVRPARAEHARPRRRRGSADLEAEGAVSEAGDDERRRHRDRPKRGRGATGPFHAALARLRERRRHSRSLRGGQPVSPPLDWEAPPEGARSYALTDDRPGLPPEARFSPRVRALAGRRHSRRRSASIAEGASGTPALPREAREFASDFVTFRIPGYGRGYGGPWPPDDAHRYVFTLYALKTERIELDDAADYVEFVRAVLPHHQPRRRWWASTAPPRRRCRKRRDAMKPLPHQKSSSASSDLSTLRERAQG